jgi:hypothetical protein
MTAKPHRNSAGATWLTSTSSSAAVKNGEMAEVRKGARIVANLFRQIVAERTMRASFI